MALIVKTDRSDFLIASLNAKIRQGAILTWTIDEDNDLTIRNPEWRNKAWFKCFISRDRLIFGIMPSRKYRMTRELYGVYHGRLAATILAHFDDIITSLELTAGYYIPYDKILNEL